MQSISFLFMLIFFNVTLCKTSHVNETEFLWSSIFMNYI